MLSKCASPTTPSSAGVKGKGSGGKGSPVTPATRGSLTPMSSRVRDLDAFPTPIPFRRQNAREFDEDSETTDAVSVTSLSLVPFDPRDQDPELHGALVPVDNMEPNGTDSTGDVTGNGLIRQPDNELGSPFSDDDSKGSVDEKWEQEMFFRDDSGSDSELSESTRRKIREAWIFRDYLQFHDFKGNHVSVAKKPITWSDYLHRNMENHGWTKFGGVWYKTGPTYRSWGSAEDPTPPRSPMSAPMSSKGPDGVEPKPKKDGSSMMKCRKLKKSLSKMASPKKSPMKVLKKPSCRVSEPMTPKKKTKVLTVEDSPRAPASKRTKAPKNASSAASMPVKKSGAKQ